MEVFEKLTCGSWLDRLSAKMRRHKGSHKCALLNSVDTLVVSNFGASLHRFKDVTSKLMCMYVYLNFSDEDSITFCSFFLHIFVN